MRKLLAEMRDQVIRHVSGIHTSTPIPHLSLGVLHQPFVPETAVCEPMMCVVLQGAKQVLVGGQQLRYDQTNFFASAIDLPATGFVLEASVDKPYVALGLSLDHALLSDLVTELPAFSEPLVAIGFGVAAVTPELIEALARLLALLDRPTEIAVLSKGREREVVYELLRSTHGPMLRRAVRLESSLSRIRKAVNRVRQFSDQKLSVEELADIAGMSAPSFHRHFKAATSLSPLQYQKVIRLHAARKMLLNTSDAGQTAYAVGYESQSQFSREYSRLFGMSPFRDAVRMRGLLEREVAPFV